MKVAEIELEVLTPMFSYGNNEFQFRLTELKSLMRSTFREIYNFDSIKDMKEKEENLFGSTEKKSPISFKIDSKINIQRDGKTEEAMLPHKENKRDKSILECIKKDFVITFYMICKDNVDIDIYIKLLMQSSVIGGLGRRSRKGFGSFKINSVAIDNNKNGYDDLINKNPLDLLKISTRECTVENISERSGESIQYNEFPKEFDCPCYPYAKKINIIKLNDNLEYMNLIEKISQLTHYRLKKQEEHSFLNDIEVNEKIDKSILGNFFTPKNERTKDYIKGLSRFASPVYVSFWENSENGYMIIKELNYDYILIKLKPQEELVQNKSIEYINKYVQRLIDIGDGQVI